MNENFAELLQESISKLDSRPGALLQATVVDIQSDYIIVNAGLKTEAYIPSYEFKNLEGEVNIKIGDTVDVVLEAMENVHGETKLSREKAKRLEAWGVLEQALEKGEIVKGMITERVRGGFTVELENIQAFLPGSLVDVRPVRDSSYLEGKQLEFKIIKLDRKNNNVVVSRRAALTEEALAEREQVMATLAEGQEIMGIVKNITDYGAFVDLGGIDGLLHITDMSWKRIKHPSEVIVVGDELKVKILKFDKEKSRVSLGLKQTGEDPWKDIERRYPVGTRLFGKVTNITDYGCFVEIEDGVEGLVHMSEIDWTNKNIYPAKFVSVGEETEVMVLDVDEAKRRISLGIKQCKSNPWELFADNHQKGDQILGKIRSITDFGVFVGLEGEIDGLVHLSDISWDEAGERAVLEYKKGQEIEAVILAIDSERERISLGIKQMEQDVYTNYLATHPKGTVVKGKVTEVNPKEAIVELGEEITGRLKVADISKTRIDDASLFFDVNDEIEAVVVGMDKRVRIINLSTKDLEGDYQSEGPANTQLGELLKQQMDQEETQE